MHWFDDENVLLIEVVDHGGDYLWRLRVFEHLGGDEYRLHRSDIPETAFAVARISRRSPAASRASGSTTPSARAPPPPHTACTSSADSGGVAPLEHPHLGDRQHPGDDDEQERDGGEEGRVAADRVGDRPGYEQADRDEDEGAERVVRVDAAESASCGTFSCSATSQSTAMSSMPMPERGRRAR